MKRFAAAAVAAVLACVAPVEAPAQKSVAYQINPEHNGATTFPEGFNAPLRVVWSRSFPDEVGQITPTTLSYAIIADGRVFFVLQREHTPRVMAVSLADGGDLWSQDLKGVDYTTASGMLAYDNGRLFAINSRGFVFAFDPATGAKLWRRKLNDATFFDGPPTARNGLLFVGGSSIGGWLFALNQDTGRIVWRRQFYDGGVASPTVTDDAVYVPYGCRLWKLDPPTGQVIWFHRRCDVFDKTVAHSAGLLFARDNTYPSLALIHDAGTGLVTKKILEVMATPAVQDGVAYLTKMDRLKALSVPTAAVNWSFWKAENPRLPPIVVNGKVLVASPAGELFVLDGTTGAELQQLSLGVSTKSCEFAPVARRCAIAAGEGRIVIHARGTLFALEGTPD